MSDKANGRTDQGAAKAQVHDWIQQFTSQLELRLRDASRDLPHDAGLSDAQAAAAQAILATFLAAGMERESALELFGQAALEARSGVVPWSDALNKQRFDLIDKEIQGTATAAESVELAGLTRIMREHVETETNLPMKGARTLHRKLLKLESTGKSD